jgi:hypothetical protein
MALLNRPRGLRRDTHGNPFLGDSWNARQKFRQFLFRPEMVPIDLLGKWSANNY